MKIIEYCYPNKCYSACTSGKSYYIYALNGNCVSEKYVPGGISDTRQFVQELQEFYFNLSLPLPKIEDVIPHKAQIAKNIFVQVNSKMSFANSNQCNYKVLFGEYSSAPLMDNLTFIEAVAKAKEIANICNMPHV